MITVNVGEIRSRQKKSPTYGSCVFLSEKILVTAFHVYEAAVQKDYVRGPDGKSPATPRATVQVLVPSKGSDPFVGIATPLHKMFSLRDHNDFVVMSVKWLSATPPLLPVERSLGASEYTVAGFVGKTGASVTYTVLPNGEVAGGAKETYTMSTPTGVFAPKMSGGPIGGADGRRISLRSILLGGAHGTDTENLTEAQGLLSEVLRAMSIQLSFDFDSDPVDLSGATPDSTHATDVKLALQDGRNPQQEVYIREQVALQLAARGSGLIGRSLKDAKIIYIKVNLPNNTRRYGSVVPERNGARLNALTLRLSSDFDKEAEAVDSIATILW